MMAKASPQIKICGLQTEHVIREIRSLPISYIGFVFAPSRRQVRPEQAAQLLKVLKDGSERAAPKAVGVFVNPSMEQLEEVMKTSLLDVIQLHGQESPAFCRQVRQRFGVDLFKALSFSAATDDRTAVQQDSLADITVEEYGDSVAALLLDTHDPEYGGGSGKTFSWDLIPQVYERANRAGMKLFVAGGLNPDNVNRLLDAYHPDGVDVSSGVETDGMKDVNKIHQFVKRVIAT